MPRIRSDEERKAIFAKLNASGGGGQRAPATSEFQEIPDFEDSFAGITWEPVPVDPSPTLPAPQPQQPQRTPVILESPTKWDLFKAGVKGFLEGAKGGLSNLTATYTYGLSDKIGLTDSSQYDDYIYRRGIVAAEISRDAAITAAGMGAVDKVAKAYAGTKIASHALGRITSSTLTAVGGFTAQSAINDWRAAHPELNPGADKALAMAADLAGFVGATGAFSIISAGAGLIGRIPLTRKALSTKAVGWLERAAQTSKDPTGIKIRETFKQLEKGYTNRPTVSTLTRLAANQVDRVIGGVGRAFKNVISGVSSKVIGKKATAKIGQGLKSLHSGYTKFSNFTGSTLKDAFKAPQSAAKVREANRLNKQAAALRKAASDINFTGGYRAKKLEAAAGKKLVSSLKYTDAGRHKAALKAHQEGMNLLRQATEVKHATAAQVAPKFKEAAELSRRAAKLAAEGKEGLKRTGYVLGMLGATTAIEEKGAGWVGEKLGWGKGIEAYKQEAKEAFKRGETYQFAMDKPRSLGATAIAAATGTVGNPIEKLLRGGWAKEQSHVGAYRAKYELIQEARDRGEITAEQAKTAFKNLAEQKPFRYEGRGVWDVSTAIGTFLKWKIGDQIKAGKRSDITTRIPDTYADADTAAFALTGKREEWARQEEAKARALAARGELSQAELKSRIAEIRSGSVRFSDINAPEVAHGPGANTIERQLGEFLGPESARRFEQLVKANQVVRLVEDSHRKAGGSDHYYRTLRTPETLPKPFDKLLKARIFAFPIGKYLVPAVDVPKKLIKEGYGDIHYRELSGITDRGQKYDAAREYAQAKGLGIWSPEAQTAYEEFAKAHPEYKPWIGKEKTVEERQAQKFRQQNQWAPPPEQKTSELQDILGIGLMTTGNTGIFAQMPRSGTASAQIWNAALALLGAIQYNERASAAIQTGTSMSKEIATDYEREMKALREIQQARIDALNAQ